MGLSKRELLAFCLFWVAVICVASMYVLDITFTRYRPADWMCFRNAVRSWRDPYHLVGTLPFYNAPWVLLILAPFALMPPLVGAGLWMAMGLVAYTLLARRFKLSLWTTGLLLLSAPVVQGSLYGQIDWLALVGLLMPPWLGLFFVLIKPQVGLGIALYWLWQAGQEKRAIKTFAPVTVAFLLSFLAYGFWPLNWLDAPMETPYGPLFPVIAMALMAVSVRRKGIKYAVIASPWLSPHAYTHSWGGAVLAIMSHGPYWALWAWAHSWIVHLLWYNSGFGCTAIQCTVMR